MGERIMVSNRSDMAKVIGNILVGDFHKTCGTTAIGGEEQIDLEPKQLTLITKKKKKKKQQMPQSRGGSLLQLTENHETLIRRASEQAAFARKVENRQFYIISESVMDGNSSTLLC